MAPVLPTVVSLATVRALYADGTSPHTLFAELSRRIDLADAAVFITRAKSEQIAAAIADLLARAPVPNSLPLWGVPFAVKDNIDVAGFPTTCACPEFAHLPAVNAVVVARLIAAGAIVMGKTNLDQFATGLNGTRSPFGIPRSVFSKDHISGGSSSGSAVAVAAGLVCFALGTDTAGSGRVPAALNNIVGIKPTPGLLSTTGLIPACRSLDCITIFGLNLADAAEARRVAEGFDAADAYSRHAEPVELPTSGLRVGVLADADAEFCGDGEAARLYASAIDRLVTGMGATAVRFDYAPFRQTAALLYEGAWVAEREEAFASFGLPETVLEPSVGTIFAKGRYLAATDAFRGLHQLEALKRRCEAELSGIDVLLLPTTPTTFTVAEMLAEPIACNAALGLYTNFCNFLGMASVAVPAGFGDNGLPYGVMLVAAAFTDDALLPLADHLHHTAAGGTGLDRAATIPVCPVPQLPASRLEIAVVGAHLSGMVLNPELLALGGLLVRAARTTADYRLFVLPETTPAKPGLIHAPGYEGPGIDVEIWSLPAAQFGRFVAKIPSPLGIGRIRLADGTETSGFLCEIWAVEQAREITSLGGWRSFVSAGMPVIGP